VAVVGGRGAVGLERRQWKRRWQQHGGGWRSYGGGCNMVGVGEAAAATETAVPEKVK